MLIFFTNTILQKKISEKLKKKNSKNFHFNFLKTKKKNRTKKSRLNVG